MDEEKEKMKGKGVEKKNDAGEKSAGGGKNGDGIGTILLKMDLHCEGCANKVRRCVRHFEGVEDVKADYSTGKLMVKGNVDPLWLRETVEKKTKKKVELLSAQPKKNGGAGGSGGGGGEEKSEEKVERKAEEKVEKKVEENKAEDEKPNKAQFNTQVVRVHCEGSTQRVKRFVIKELTPYLKDKLKRKVEAAPPKKAAGSDGRGDNKKEKEVARGRGDGSSGRKKKDGESKVASKSTEPKEKKSQVMNKMEYYSGCSNPNTYNAMRPMFNQNYYNQDYGVRMHDHGYSGRTGYVPPPPYFTTPHDHGYSGRTGYVPPPPYFTTPHDHGYVYRTGNVSPQHFTTPGDHGYGPTGYVSPPYLLTTQRDHGYDHSGYVPPPYTAPEYFSDENPNACSVM